jgi:RNA polymerase sigma-70 factor (ECF subfamily)
MQSQEQTIALYHPLLQSAAQKLLRCKADAEDMVQETFIKWLSIDQSTIKNTKAYLMTAVTNNCLNHLNALKRKKEEYLESFHLPEFLVKIKESDFAHLDFEVEVSKAFKLILSKLEPLERAIYLLKEAFNFDYDLLQELFDKKKEHLRQLVSRARKKLGEKSEMIEVSHNRAQLADSFLNACKGNISDFINTLKQDISELSVKKLKK